jgi:hypothetical protein
MPDKPVQRTVHSICIVPIGSMKLRIVAFDARARSQCRGGHVKLHDFCAAEKLSDYYSSIAFPLRFRQLVTQ